MTSIELDELRERLPEYVGRAAAGERVLVTDRDRVVAELGPPRPEPVVPEGTHPALAQLVREGLATPPSTPRGTVPGRHPRAKLADLLAELDADRADRW